MKKLSVAILGLAGFAFAGMAAAACPTDVVPPWSGKTQTQGAVAVATGGYDGTECRMTSVLNAGSGAFAAATVRDDSPSNEPRYRAQFLVNADGLTGLGTFAAAQMFSVQSAAAHLGSNFLVQMGISGGANKNLNIITANQGASGNISSNFVPLAAGVNRIEIDLQMGATGSLKVWLNSGVEASPTLTFSSVNNAGWVGANRANLGLAAANNIFRANNAGQLVSFDQFDSRRTTFIGTP